jgi:lipopolysaccharide biosynthesis regulator YciM/uncharacterized integral membrane protein
LLLIAAGYVAFLNPDPVVVRLTPGRTVTHPLAVALLVSFLVGASFVALAAGARAGARGWRSWRRERRERRAAQRAAVTAHVRELVWGGDYAQARAELLRHDRGAPADAARLELLAETYLGEGNPAAARPLLEEGLGRWGKDPHLLALLADAAERGGDAAAAVDALARAYRERPQSPRLARRLRDLHAAAGRWSEAVALQGDILLALRDPVLLAAEGAVLRGLRYQAALQEPDPRRATRLLVGIAREDPRFVPAWVSAGDQLLRAGRRVAARRLWERGARRQPAVVLLERIERLNGDEGKAARTTRLYRRLQRRQPGAHVLALLLTRHLLAEGAIEEAAQTLAALPAPLANHPVAQALWGEIHRRRGNHTLAADTLARAVAPDLAMLAPFRCLACQEPADAWEARCRSCGRWGTLQARVEWAVAEPS